MKARFFASVFAVLLLLSSCAKPADKPSVWVSRQTYEGAMSDVGYYYQNDAYLYYADFSTGINVCLCSRVGCTHDNEQLCEAAVITQTPHKSLFAWNDKLYYIGFDGYGTHVFRRNADGTGSSKVASLCAEYTKQKKDVCVMEYVLADGFLYYRADIRDLVEVSEGAFVVQTDCFAICKLNLTTGKDEVLFTERECVLYLWAARVGEILCFTYKAPENPGSENYNELLQQTPCQLFTWSENTQQRTVLFDKKYRDCSAIYGFMDGKLYYNYSTDENYYNVTAFDIETKKETLFGHDAPRFINSRYSLYMISDSKQYIIMDYQTGTELPVSFEGQFLRIVNVSDKAMILLRGQYKPGTNSLASAIYCYVPLSALADGLQETDVTDFFIEKRY